MCLNTNNSCDSKNFTFICSFKWKILYNPLLITISVFLIWCFGVVHVLRKKYKKEINDDLQPIDEEKIYGWFEKNNIDVAKQYFLKDVFLYYANKDREKYVSNNFFKENEKSNAKKSNDDNFLQQIEPNSEIQIQMKQAKLNTYNNSYLTFCLLIDRCKTINFKENNDYQENEKPYCFQEIAEAFGLDWNGKRYLCYIANVLNQIFKFTEQQNNQEDTIPTINASTVTKFERDNFNKWFCNGHIRGSGRHCYPKYTLIEGKEDREYILELCNIVKEAKKNKIEKWKEDFYGYLTNNKGTFDILGKEKLNEIYKEYNNKTITKMSYQKLEEKIKQEKNEETSNDKKNGGKNK